MECTKSDGSGPVLLLLGPAILGCASFLWPNFPKNITSSLRFVGDVMLIQNNFHINVRIG